MDNAGAWEVVETAVAAVRNAQPTVLVIEGEPGQGKSRLLRMLSRALDDFEVRRAYGEPDAPDVAFRTLAELTDAAGMEAPANPLQAVNLLLSLVDELQRDRPLAFLIDDLQWADAESVRALGGLMRRSERDRLLVAVATRPLGRTHGEWQRMLRDAATTTVRLDGLTVDEVADLVREADPAATADIAAALHEHTTGNPLHVISLLNEHSVESLTAMAEADELPAPLELAAHVESRVQVLSPDAGVLLSALAVLGDGWVALETAGAVAGISDPRSAARVLAEERLVRSRGALGTDIRIFHSVLRAAVYEVIPDDRRRRLHRAAAEHAQDPGVGLRHRVAAADADAAPQLTTELVAYAGARHDERQYREAARFLRAAAAITPDRVERDALLLDAQFDALLGLDPDARREHLGRGDARDRLVVAMSLTGRAEWHLAWTHLAGLGDDDIAALPERVAYRVRTLRLFDALGSGRPAEEIFADLAAAERLEPDPALVRYLLYTKLQATAWSIGDQERYRRMCGMGEDRATLTATPAGRSLLAWRGMTQALDGDVDGAIADLSIVTALIGDGGMDFTEGNYHAMLGLARYLSGDFGRALASIDVSLSTGLDHTHPVSLAISGLRELVGGDAEAARRTMADVRAGLMRNHYLGAVIAADITELLVLAATGEDDERREWIRLRRQELGDPLEERPSIAPSLWLALHGLAATWAGDADAARAWSDHLARTHGGLEWHPAMRAWISARIAAAAGHDSTRALIELARTRFASVPVFRGLVARDAAASAKAHGEGVGRSERAGCTGIPPTDPLDFAARPGAARRRHGRAVRAGTLCGSARRRRHELCADRQGALHHAEHGRLPPLELLRQDGNPHAA